MAKKAKPLASPVSVAFTLAWLEKRGSKRVAEGLGRFGIVTKLKVVGVPMATLNAFLKEFGTDQALSLALWKSGCYEARLLAAMVGDPEKVTKAQMNAWAASFENWADCDTACFKLFDQTPHAWELAKKWSASEKEFVKRGGFALMACLALHRKEEPDAKFLAMLPLIEKGAADDRNFVKKGVNWALRGIGQRKSPALKRAAMALAKKLSESKEAHTRWVGKDALRQLSRK
ncbi:DNA alkylation repair protein [Usitatibacter palustris]|uniref:DNA alkylation repair protein n=1 Tax=Usitatibacter palustris TaxID=2732487 RepID=A0A6M4H688_9PROT|nr:DNA alkylation repair protein [Usitatibacter palustris]QJR14852.1 hypothetical protein DSM104440_01667 [Usitatibacter palustris]